MSEDDPTIQAIRDARHRISAMVGHDPYKLVEYLRQFQKRHCEESLPQEAPTIEKPHEESAA